MDIHALLTRVGLSQKEGDTYLSLISNGPATLYTISQQTGIHRPTLHSALPQLQNKGLVTISLKGKRTYYVAEHPSKLKGLLAETEHAIEEAIPQIRAMFESRDEKPIVKFLEGKKGISFVFEDLVRSLNTGDVFYRYSSTSNVPKADQYLPPDYRVIRDQKKLERFLITSEAQAKGKKKRLERAIKIVPKQYGLFDYDITQVIYGNKIAFVDYNTETAIIIENKLIATFQKQLFKMLYSKLS